MALLKEHNGYECWLRLAPVEDHIKRKEYQSWCSSLVTAADRSVVMETAARELSEGITSILGTTVARSAEAQQSSAIYLGVLGHMADIDAILDLQISATLQDEGYVIQTVDLPNRKAILLAGKSDKGALYAVFHFLRLLQSGESLNDLYIVENPKNGLRMINQWDNMNGSIERGYAGKTIFYHNNQVVTDMKRIRDYARLLASIGINAISINNVNVHEVESRLITEALLPDVARIADVFRAYGIQIFLSINYASPIQIGGLSTADPLDPGVKQWWSDKAADIYKQIPDFGGFLVKADSEFRPGPFTYGRDHVDGANVLAEALEPHGGLVIWRCFVYNCLQDWRDRSTDRAKAAHDHFKPLDGKFLDNVILQVKNGPMDFQVREPVSPLLGVLPNTNQVLELQITQEYTGQQKHVCFLVPQWKEVLDFDTHAKGSGSTIAEIASGSLFGRKLGGIAAVSNIGDDMNWTGHILAQANLYGFGRLTWNPALTSEQIVKEWIVLTFGSDPAVVETISRIMLDSWGIYENYTAPLGVGWMVNPSHHYGPNVDGYEYSKWGTYHFADNQGIGVNRTVQSGTGYTAQYHRPQSDLYESVESCPDELLLFFHLVPYTHKLKSGKTVIQHIYDTHFLGVEQASHLVQAWSSLQDKVDTNRYEQVLTRLTGQAEHAKEWRDIINTYFLRKSGIPDEHNRTIY
ncbi:alpha-glucuronidase [Paenibacillus sp. 1_12]|uniref:alpha-glucuronidase family glycosyl hydrolase n=1 Tax=Paenibacillus sp. 1_12 TaxID=1566278 RepID=UPI0008EF1587|nr:alpha-glucuronidase family glycosyl hydrolase [Paenibacillus sp. 1_12]SFK82251.1 alpha-glucuronidase [Paenibacillus sp. 1_12]